MEWGILRFDEIATLINGRAYLMPELLDSGKYRIIRVGNFTGKDEWFYSDMELDDDKYCSSGDLLYKWACTFGPEIWKEEKVIYHYHIWKVINHPDKVDKMFLYWYLKYYTPQWLGGTNGSTMVHITKASMEKKKIYLPLDVKIQQQIATVLNNYDQLIENNNKRIKLLESMAESLYKEWFVRFRFPGYEKAEFENGMPKGWNKCRLRDIAIESGKPVKKEKRGNFEHYLPIDCLPNRKMMLQEEDCIENAESSLESFSEGDILFGAMRTYFHKVIIAPFNGITRSTCFIIRSKDETLQNFLYLFLYQDSTVDYSSTVSVGSTMPYVRWKDLNRINVILPDKNIVLKFNKLIEPILKLIRETYYTNRSLAQQRDSLLPRLMSGKLSVEGKEVV